MLKEIHPSVKTVTRVALRIHNNLCRKGFYLSKEAEILPQVDFLINWKL